MMLRAWIGLLVVGMLAVGCGDDDGGTPDAGSPVDQCVGVEDMAVIATIEPPTVDGGVVDGGVDPVPGWLTDCSRSPSPCASILFGGTDEEITECMRTCLEPTALSDLSEGCEQCYINTIICARRVCALPCAGSDMSACLNCTETNCTPLYHQCRGL